MGEEQLLKIIKSVAKVLIGSTVDDLVPDQVKIFFILQRAGYLEVDSDDDITITGTYRLDQNY